MESKLVGKKALVTGGTRGIGRGIVLALVRAGADVTTCYGRDRQAGEGLGRDLEKAAGDHHVVQADVGCPDDLQRLVAECAARYGSLDVVVHNAGAISHFPLAQLGIDEWRRVLDTNLTAAFLLVQKTLPMLREGASVVFVGSRVATGGVPLRAHYTAAKAGLIGLTRSLAKELGPRGIRVNVVAPGPTETDADLRPEVRRRYEQMIALGRLGRPADVAGVVLFLAGDSGAFVSGETINVDGGI
jgi:3-oxoacyl-[acyl-carrier protein] reductase